MGMQNSKYLVAGYPFEGNANDIKGVNNGTVFGATFVDGKIGRALSFDGVDDYVDLGTTIYCPTTAAWSISLRFKIPSGAIPAYGGLFSLLGENHDFALFYSNIFPYNLTACYFCGWGLTTETPPSRDVYHHCVVVYDPLSIGEYKYKIFVDCQNQPTKGVPAIVARTRNYIGKYTGNNVKGKIDSFKIYSKALTQSEIQRDYLNLPIL